MKRDLEMPCEFLAFDGKTPEEREAEWNARALLLLLQAFPGATVEEAA